MKTCITCGRLGAAEDFTKKGTRRESRCRACYNAMKRARYHSVPAARASILASYKRHYSERLEKVRARSALRQAIRVGALIRRPCAVCGSMRSQGHHWRGYAPEYRLDVLWLCAPHHGEEHRRLRGEEAAA